MFLLAGHLSLLPSHPVLQIFPSSKLMKATTSNILL
jgi:hypothetical protein